MAPGGRLPGWHPAREFHHGPELKRSIREAEDTDAVDLSLNSKIKYQDAEKNLREKDMGQLRLLDRRSPDTASLVLRTSPPPCRPNLTLAGCRLAHATPPAGLPVLRPSPPSTRAAATTPAEPVGARVARFPTAGSLPRIPGGSASASLRYEACAAFTSLRPAWSLNRPGRPFVIGVLQPMSLPPSSAPTATGWSDSCRAGFAPAGEWRLSRRTKIQR